MKTLLAFCIALLGLINISAQGKDTIIVAPNRVASASNTNPNRVYTIVQQQPRFPGNINMWLSNNIVYPVDAKNNNIQGTVYVSFVIEKDGSISNVKVLRGVQGGMSLENEAVRVISIIPRWAPGMQNGHTVRVQYTVPIRFVLKDNTSPNNNNTANPWR